MPKPRDSGTGEVVNWLHAAARTRRQKEELWLSNQTFFLGEEIRVGNVSQIFAGSTTPDVEDPELPRIAVNLIRTTVETATAKLAAKRPGQSVMPATDDDSDRMRASGSDKLLRFLWHAEGISPIWYEFLKALNIFGTSFLYADFDPSHAPPAVDPLGGGIEGVEGGYRIEALPPWQVYVDDSAPSLRLAHWIAIARDIPYPEFSLRWPEIEPSPADTIPDGRSSRLSRFAERSLRVSGAGELQRARVYDIYVRAGKGTESGRHLVMHGENVLLDENWPEEWPVTDLRYYVLPGHYWAESYVADAAHIALEIARTVNQIAHNREMIGNPPLIEPAGSVVGDEPLEARPGAVWTVNPMVKEPHFAAVAEVPAFVQVHLQRMLELYELVSGVSGITRGTSNPSESGRKLAYQAELDSTKFGPVVERIARASEWLGARLLKLWRRHVPGAVTFRVLGDNAVGETVTLHSEDIRSFDVVVDQGSILPESRTVEQDFVLQLAAQRVLESPAAGMYTKLLGYEGLAVATDPDAKQKAWAEENWVLLTKGFTVPRTDDDAFLAMNVPVHVKVFLDNMADGGFRRLPLTIQGQVEQYVKTLIARTAQMAAAAGPSGAAPGGAEGAPAGGAGLPERPAPVGSAAGRLGPNLNPAGPGVRGNEEAVQTVGMAVRQ